MKTLELDLKKKVLIVDLPIDSKNVYMSGNSVIYNTDKSCIAKPINDEYEFLCKGSELTEEIASEVMSDFDAFNEFALKYEYLKNFIYIVESKGFYWLENECDNQFCENGKVYLGYNTFLNCLVCEKAEEKTFRNPLIFVKK